MMFSCLMLCRHALCCIGMRPVNEGTRFTRHDGRRNGKIGEECDGKQARTNLLPAVNLSVCMTAHCAVRNAATVYRTPELAATYEIESAMRNGVTLCDLCSVSADCDGICFALSIYNYTYICCDNMCMCRIWLDSRQMRSVLWCYHRP